MQTTINKLTDDFNLIEIVTIHLTKAIDAIGSLNQFEVIVDQLDTALAAFNGVLKETAAEASQIPTSTPNDSLAKLNLLVRFAAIYGVETPSHALQEGLRNFMECEAQQ